MPWQLLPYHFTSTESRSHEYKSNEEENDDEDDDQACVEEQSTLVQLFPLPVKVSNAYLPIDLQELDSDGNPLAFCLGLATYLFTNEEGNKMLCIVLSNNKQELLKLSVVHWILKEQGVHHINP